jgi:hypothetical protein
MVNRISAIVLLSVALALSATACGNVPGIASQAPAPVVIPTSVPVIEPTPVATPVAPQARGKELDAARGLDTLLKGLGLKGGVVTSNNDGTLGLRLGKTTEQVRVASNAIIVLPDNPNAQVSDIRVGDRVIAEVGDDANAPATFLLDFPRGYDLSNLRLGAVMPGKSGSLTLRGRGGTHAVTTSGATMIVNITGDQPALGSLDDLKPGAVVLAVGNASDDAFSAQVIVLLEKNLRDLGKGKRNLPPPAPSPGA